MSGATSTISTRFRLQSGFLHVLEHCGKHGAPGGQDDLVSVKLLLTDNEGDVTVALRRKELREIFGQVSLIGKTKTSGCISISDLFTFWSKALEAVHK